MADDETLQRLLSAGTSEAGLPPVHPHLVDHLRAAFLQSVPPSPHPLPGMTYSESNVFEAGRETGLHIVIDYLATLTPQYEAPETPTNVPSEAQGASPDSRRPGARERS